MPKVSSLSVFFPCYNEEANVENMVRKAQQVLPEIAEKWEIIPVNDGSKDKTGEIIDRLAKEDPNVHPVHHIKNQGYGGAVISGYNAAKCDLVFFTDGDLQFDLREITLLIEKLDEGDLILGFRKNRRDPLQRKLNAFLWGSLVKTLFSFKVKDVDCAFKLIKRRVIDKVQLSAGGAMVSTELLARANRTGFRFVEVGVTHYPRVAGTQTGANFKVILKAFRELFKLYGKIKNQPK
ncbi:MAG TPA: glycosyltransferase family 2 protein [bacterium]|jgi:glycosyltransferase involved in cell wall biosynthesis|nr:glycosyltransferase family 2 protein [bacterium]